MTVKRYNIYANNEIIERHKSNEVEHSDGEWVKYSDHVAEIGNLRAKVAELEAMVPRWVLKHEAKDPYRFLAHRMVSTKEGWSEWWLIAPGEDPEFPPIPLPGEER